MTDQIITIKDLSYRYNETDPFALRDITLDIRRGEYVAIMGPTGAGKTTFCLALNGIVPHFYGGDFFGSVTVADLDTVEHPTYELAEYVGMVFEDPEIQLTAPSVAREIAFALENLCVPRDEILRRIPDALAEVRLEGTEQRHPHQLSGGQKQRLAIAAALAVRPDILVLDEPTSQLDPVGAEEVFAVARSLNREHGITIVLASHSSEEVAEYADRVLLLSAGRLVREASPQRFFANIDVLRANEIRPPEVTLAFEQLFEGSSLLPELPVTLTDAVEDYQQLHSHLTLCEAVEFGDDGTRPHKQAPVLQAVDLSFTYDNGTEALQDISLNIAPGEYVAIIGQNGAGKSTLVRHFLHLLEPTSGEVRVSGRSVTGFTVSELAQQIGYISQNPDNQIFSDSVRGEVAFALKNLQFPEDEIERRVQSALEEMKLEWAAERHPLTLSKGDRSRIVIAAILAMEPDILIFDEPTTGQDYKGARAIMDLTKELHAKGRTIIVITHHLYLLPGYAKRLVVMGKGKILLDGPLRQIFYNSATLAETYLAPPQVVQFMQSIYPDGELPQAHPVAADELSKVFALT